jgi:hypothetical protein
MPYSTTAGRCRHLSVKRKTPAKNFHLQRSQSGNGVEEKLDGCRDENDQTIE